MIEDDKEKEDYGNLMCNRVLYLILTISDSALCMPDHTVVGPFGHAYTEIRLPMLIVDFVWERWD